MLTRTLRSGFGLLPSLVFDEKVLLSIKMKLPPPKIDFRSTFGTFLLFYSTIFSTGFTVDFLNLYSLVKYFYLRDGISPLVMVSYPSPFSPSPPYHSPKGGHGSL